MTFLCRSFILLTIFILPFQCAVSQGLKGYITNSRGEPLPFATIYLKEARMGTATNLDGYYNITLTEGTYSITYQHLGYKPVYQTITITDKTVESNITLTEQVFEMPEIVVRANEKDRAYYIMRKAIGMAPWHLKQVKSYEAEVYIKGGGRINRMPKLLMRQMKAETNQGEIKEGQYYFSESVNIINFTSPDKYTHRVVSSRSNIPVSQAGTSPLDYIKASFYQPVLINIAISPLAPNAFSHYNFRFLGATSQGNYMINKIQVTPKRKSQQLFTGTIFIVEDEWSIQSLDLTNENAIGKIRVQQLYLPVEGKIWMPVNHDFNIVISVIGVKAEASYASSVKYTMVDADRKAASSSEYLFDDAPEISEKVNAKSLEELETILEKDKINPRDMARLSKLNREISEPEEKEPLEVKENTTYIIDKDATAKDSLYWERVRTIPLTEAEKVPVRVSSPGDTSMAQSNTITISFGGGNKTDKASARRFTQVIGAAVTGKEWTINKNNSLTFDGLASLRTFAFNTVDGFTAGTGLTWTLNTGKESKFSLNPAVRYAFSRKTIMWSINTGLNFDSYHQSSVTLQAGSVSKDFAYSGINPFINTISSLGFRYNWMKLYKSDFITFNYKSEIVNGLVVRLAVGGERRQTIENTTDFSFFKPGRDYTPNIPDNPFIGGEVEGFGPFVPVNHDHFYVSGEMTYTLRQKYKIQNSVKVNLPSDNPVFHLLWKHGFNHNDTLSGHYDYLSGDIYMNRGLGALRQISWKISGGCYFNRQNLQLQDIHMFNTQSSPVLINNYQDVFLLKQNYAIATPSLFTEAHLKYTTPCLLIKRLPVLSKTLMRENINLSWLWTPGYGHYTEAGYSISELFFFAEAGVYAGFRNYSFESAGVRLVFNLPR